MFIITGRQIEIDYAPFEVIEIDFYRARCFANASIRIGCSREDRSSLTILQEYDVQPASYQRPGNFAIEHAPAKLARTRIGTGNEIEIFAAAIENGRLRVRMTIRYLVRLA